VEVIENIQSDEMKLINKKWWIAQIMIDAFVITVCVVVTINSIAG
jgi:hypothetical protein